MSRYIDADVLRDLIDGGYDIDFDEVPETKKALLHMVDYQETVDVRENVHGEWIFGETMGHSWMKCSNCCVSQSGQTATFSFCPNCGADMRGEEQ